MPQSLSSVPLRLNHWLTSTVPAYIRMDAWLKEDRLLLRAPLHSLGTEIEITDSLDQILLTAWRTAKLWPEYYVSTSPGLALMTIKSRLGLLWSFEVLDENERTIGILRRAGWLSLFTNTWNVVDSNNCNIARVVTEPGVETVFGHEVYAKAGGRVATVTPTLSLTRETILTFERDALDRRLIIAIAIILMMRR